MIMVCQDHAVQRQNHGTEEGTQTPSTPEAPPGFEPGIKDLQSSALPLGHGARYAMGADSYMLPPPLRERETGLEPATCTLATCCSTN